MGLTKHVGESGAAGGHPCTFDYHLANEGVRIWGAVSLPCWRPAHAQHFHRGASSNLLQQLCAQLCAAGIMQEVRQSQRNAAKAAKGQVDASQAEQQPASQPSYFPQASQGAGAQQLAQFWAATNSQAGPLQAFYNAGLYGGMPLPYGFPNPAAPTDATGDQVNAVSAAVSAAMQSQPADGIAQGDAAAHAAAAQAAAAAAAVSLPSILNQAQVQQLLSAPGLAALMQQTQQQQQHQHQQQASLNPPAGGQQAAGQPAVSTPTTAQAANTAAAWANQAPSSEGGGGSGDGEPTDEREAKRLRRKQSNRESARRSRQKKQQECDGLSNSVKALTAENARLKEENLQLQAKVDVLMSQLHGQGKPFSAAPPAEALALPQPVA